MVAERLSILQIIPANGWKAIWEHADNEDVDGEEEIAPLVCWALVEDPHGDRFVTGLDGEPGGFGFVAGDENFRGYVAPDGTRVVGSAPGLE